MGSSTDEDSWVRGRQYTGRIVTVLGEGGLVGPVFNYSAAFDFLWEELSVPVPHTGDWHRAERILLEEAQRVSASVGAERAMAEMTRRYPVPRTEVEPRVFARATDNYIELSARFVVPMRPARSTKDAMTRRVLERFAAAGIGVAPTTVDVTVRHEQGDGTGTAG